MLVNKLSEQTLGSILNVVYARGIITPQKRVKVLDKICIVDYEVVVDNIIIYFEFDGPTHYCSSKTQLRDIRLQEYCTLNNIELIRIPYFIQLNPWNTSIFIPYSDDNNISSEYFSGFFDTKIIYPGDFNAFGYRLFIQQVNSYVLRDREDIINSLLDGPKQLEEVLGINYIEEMNALII